MINKHVGKNCKSDKYLKKIAQIRKKNRRIIDLLVINTFVWTFIDA